MTLSNRIGRPLLAAMFVNGGVDQLRNPESKKGPARTVTDEVGARVEDAPLPDDPVDLVRINGGVQVVAGSLLALNKLPRLAALALAGSLVPTTLAAHRFWEIDDEQERAQQRIQFLKNVSMLGGLIIAAGDTGARPSAAWQARRSTKRAIDDATSTVGDVAGEVSGTTRRFRRKTSDLAGTASDRVAGSLPSNRGSSGPGLRDAGAAASEAFSDASDVLADAFDRAQPVLETAADETRSRLRDARKASRPIARKARKRAKKRSDVLAKRAAKAGARSKVAARDAIEQGATAVRSATS